MDKVTEADRDAAADWFYGAQKDGVIRRGSKDDAPLVQAFAAHRRQAEKAMKERAAAVCLAAKYGDIFHDAETQSHDDCCEALYTAIRSMEVE
jgi:hypothetical protein